MSTAHVRRADDITQRRIDNALARLRTELDAQGRSIQELAELLLPGRPARHLGVVRPEPDRVSGES